MGDYLPAFNDMMRTVEQQRDLWSPRAPVSSFHSMPIHVSPNMPDDKAFLDPNGTYHVSPAMREKLMEHMEKHLRGDKDFSDAFAEVLKPTEPKTDPEKEAMQSNELWGAF